MLRSVGTSATACAAPTEMTPGRRAGYAASLRSCAPAGRAVELRYKAQFGTTPLVSLVQFAFVHAGSETVVTYTSLPKRATHNLPSFLRSIRSLRWS